MNLAQMWQMAALVISDVIDFPTTACETGPIGSGFLPGWVEILRNVSFQTGFSAL